MTTIERTVRAYPGSSSVEIARRVMRAWGCTDKLVMADLYTMIARAAERGEIRIAWAADGTPVYYPR